MIRCIFVADEQDIDVKERQYVRGEAGTAETCDSYCMTMGRGHVHVLPCDPARCDLHGPSLVDGRRHTSKKYSDGTEASAQQAKDELTHDAYYSALGFEDPCNDEHQASFKLCAAQCGSLAHGAGEDEGW